MRPRLPATGTQPSRDAMAKRAKRVRTAGRKLWTAIGLAVCREKMSTSCSAALYAPFDISTLHRRSELMWTRQTPPGAGVKDG
jgi:hypothetical protein